jgi:hypothetical protein
MLTSTFRIDRCSLRRAFARSVMPFVLAGLAGCGASPRTENQSANGPLTQFVGGPAAPGAADAAEVVRDIEEADVVKVVGSTIYVLNPYKGLIIVDASNADAPVVKGTFDLKGRGVEMYVVGQRVYVVLSADFAIGFAEDGVVSSRAAAMPPAPDFSGSQLAIVDVADPAAPASMGKINLVGYANASRRVGNVIYVIGNTSAGYYYYADPQTAPVNEGFVASVNVANPNNIVPVERKTFSGQGLLLHASQTALFAAAQQYDSNAGQSTTNIRYIDISDPAGAITLRGNVVVPGFIRNRFYMDDYQGVLRVATETNGFGFRQVRVYTYDLADPDAIAPLGQADIIQGESLEAVRFDGPRGYAVTFLRVDPLFVLDLSDPAHPSVSGHLEVPGFSTHIEPRGDRLIAVGVDDTDGRRPAVAYYDVSDPENPSELGRVVLGPPGSFTDSDATWDEKAFKIVDELGLIVIPFQHVDPSTIPEPIPLPFPRPLSAQESPARPGCLNAVQLVDFGDSGLTRRGWFEHRGRVNRVGTISTRLFALSAAALQTVNIDDRDAPAKAGEARFFSDEELALYGGDCGFIFIDFPVGGFDLSRMCGGVQVLPVAVLMLGLSLLKRRRS